MLIIQALIFISLVTSFWRVVVNFHSFPHLHTFSRPLSPLSILLLNQGNLLFANSFVWFHFYFPLCVSIQQKFYIIKWNCSHFSGSNLRFIAIFIELCFSAPKSSVAVGSDSLTTFFTKKKHKIENFFRLPSTYFQRRSCRWCVAEKYFIKMLTKA